MGEPLTRLVGLRQLTPRDPVAWKLPQSEPLTRHTMRTILAPEFGSYEGGDAVPAPPLEHSLEEELT